MLVPDFWAEATCHQPRRGRERNQVTVRRFGWSNDSQADAQAMAEQRAQEAFRRVLAGDPLERRERRAAYNGAEGLPIREEVLSRHDAGVVVTRNSFGAQCLNTPNVLFADVDLEEGTPAWMSWTVFLALALLALLVGAWLTLSLVAGILVFVAALVARPLARALQPMLVNADKTPEALAKAKVKTFVERHAEWTVRIYRTPKGLRLLVTHRTFAPDEEEVQTFFDAVGADPIYVRMCQNQRCFRARISPKPWRMGLSNHIVPHRGSWPVTDSEKLKRRQAWVIEYERKAEGYASCRYLTTYGPDRIHVDVNAVVRLHDDACQAKKASLPLA